jgi:hypothetical protein
MCGRRLIGKNYFGVDAALVGCVHLSGLLVRRGWPLALMLCADQVPIQMRAAFADLDEGEFTEGHELDG